MLIPYKCRCEALGENKRRGGLYKSLRSDSDLNFTVNASWKSGRAFICGREQTVILNGKTINLNGKQDVSDVLDFSGLNKISENDAFLIKRPVFYVESATVAFKDNAIVISLSFGPSGKPKALGVELYDENLSLTDKALAETDEIIFKNIDPSKEYTILLVTDDECFKINVPEKVQNGFNMSKITNANKKVECDFDFKLFGENAKLLEIINNSEIIPEMIDYEVFNQQDVTFKGSAKLPEIKPGSSKVVKLDFDFPSLSFFEYFLKLNIEGNVKIIKLPSTQSEPESYYTTEMNDIVFTENSDCITVSGTNGDDFKVLLSKLSGEIEAFEKDGVLYIDNKNSENKAVSFMILENTPKYITALVSYNGYSVFYAIYGDGEVGVSVIGNAEIKLPIYSKFNNAYYFGDAEMPGIYDEKITNKEISDVRFFAAYANDLSAMLIKCMPTLDIRIEKNNALLCGNDTYSFTVRFINMGEEDIVREARTLPAIEQNV